MRKGTYRKQPNISIDTLFDFFKTLNQNPTNDGDGETVLPEIDENLVNNLNIEINGHITSEEILHGVKNLKNEKVCGDKGNNKITELRTILQRESQNS
jgi:hypothetical protein